MAEPLKITYNGIYCEGVLLLSEGVGEDGAGDEDQPRGGHQGKAVF